MKRYIIIFIFAIILAGCTKEQKSGESVVRFGVKEGAEDVIIRGTKAAADGRTYKLTVNDSKGDAVGSIEDLTSTNNKLTLLTGSYTAKVESGAMSLAAFDAPYYIGESSFAVEAYRESAVDVKLKLGNVKVSVEYTDALKAFLNDATAKVEMTAGGELSYSFSEIRAGYFEPKAVQNIIKWSVTFASKSGKTETLTGTVKEIKANDHLIIRFGVGEDTSSGLTLGNITVNESISKVVSYDFEIDFAKQPQIMLVGGDIDVVNDLSFDAATPLSPMSVLIKGFPSIDALTMAYNMTISGSSNIEIVKNGNFSTDSKIADYKTLGVNIELFASNDGASNPVKVTFEEKFLTTLKATTGSEVYEFTFSMIDNKGKVLTKSLKFTITDNTPVPVIDVVTNELMAYEKWATKLEVSGKWISATKPSALSFEYKKASETTWKSIVATSSDDATKTFKATILGLEAGTEYQVRAKSVLDAENTVNATTERANQMYNSNFDLWSVNDGITYARENNANAFWDSGNTGSKIGSTMLTTKEASDVVKGSAARLETKNITVIGISKMAAGNIYTGTFNSLNIFNQTPNIDFGRPFTTRPASIEGYYKYKSVNISSAHSSLSRLNGKPDRFSMTVILTDKIVNLNAKNVAPFDIDKIHATGTDGKVKAIASAHFTNEVTTDGVDATPATNMANYEKFKLALKYHESNKTMEPKYIIVVFAASKYGDLYTGGIGSTLLIDEVTLDYNFDK